MKWIIFFPVELFLRLYVSTGIATGVMKSNFIHITFKKAGLEVD